MRHAPFFCEENVWHLARDPDVFVDGVSLTALRREAVFVTNAARAVPTWAQRAGDPVVWDYHVALCARGPLGWRMLDLDSTLGFCIAALAWLDGSFRAQLTPPDLAPRFRVVDSHQLAATFSSDRSHMLDEGGAPTRPLPPWAPIGCPLGPMTLPRFLDPTDAIAGEWLDLMSARRRYADPA